MSIIIKIFVIINRTIYFFLKLRKTRNKITLLSRQSNTITKDFLALANYYKGKAEIFISTKRVQDSATGILKYYPTMLKQMFNIANSKLVILDSYSIPVSILNHKKDLKVIQAWHAFGLMKRAGWSAVKQDEGRDIRLAKLLKMHNNYDYFLTTSDLTTKELSKLFGYNKEGVYGDKKITPILSLPPEYINEKINFDFNNFNWEENNATENKNKKNESKQNESEEKNSVVVNNCDNSKEDENQINNDDFKNASMKKENEKTNEEENSNILYAPTFRKDETELAEKIKELIKEFENSKFNLLIKIHPNSKINIPKSKRFKGNESVRYLISDYSCIIYEYLLKGVPVFFYGFDVDHYEDARGFLFDYEKEMPNKICRTAEELRREIEAENFDEQKQKTFYRKYVAVDSCDELVETIDKIISEE